MDLTDSIISNSNILLLSETRMLNNETISVPNFNCVAQFQRQKYRSGGVAILQHQNDNTNFITRNMSLQFRRNELNEVHAEFSDIGEICSSHLAMQDGQTLVLIAIYISPGHSVKDIINFIARSLMIYSEYGSKFTGSNEHTMPIILGGDFNCNFKDEKSKPLVDFLTDKFNLKMNNDPNSATTKTGTTIDAIFTRFIEKIQSKTFLSYFSYHHPIVTFVPYNNENSGVQIT